MGRIKGSPSGGETNPLQRMLGTFLRLERARLGLSTADVAQRLGLTDTYYRLAESGRAALNQSLTFRIIEVFAASSTPTHVSGAISFTRFAIFLVGAHWVGAEMASMQIGQPAARRATEALALRENDFQILYERIMGFFDLEEGSGEQKRFLEDVAAPEVGRFLRDESYGRPDVVDREFLDMGDLPTLSIDIILNLKKSLSGRSFVHTDEIAAKWESENSRQFKYARGLFKSSELIINQENLDIFNYDYLKNDDFLEIHMIFLNSEYNEDELKEIFISMVNKGREKHNIKPIDAIQKDKIKFYLADKLFKEKYNNEIELLLFRDFKFHEAYWSFETHIGLMVSFVGVRLKDVETIRNLNLQDSEKKASQFSEIWKKLDV